MRMRSSQKKPLHGFGQVGTIGNHDKVLLHSSPENRSEADGKVKEALNGME